MIAMVLDASGLAVREIDTPEPANEQVLVKVKACGVCRTDLHVVDGDLPHPTIPVIPGHEIVGEVVSLGANTTRWQRGDKVGIPWLAGTCGCCKYCQRDEENLCDDASFHGYTVNGGYAEYVVAHQDYCYALAGPLFTIESAPLLCAGIIGYRSYRKTQLDRVRRLGLYGFGAAAHLLAQLAVHDGRDVYAFTRTGDDEGQAFARSLGCVWSGASTERPPKKLDAAIVFAPVGALLIEALRSVDKGGQVVAAGIHMSPVPQFEYRDLWEERSLHSVANLQRRDGEEYLERAAKARLRATVQTYDLTDAPRALDDLRHGRLNGAGVLVP